MRNRSGEFVGVFFVIISLVVIVVGCSTGGISPPGEISPPGGGESITGDIIGYAFLKNESDHSGIIITVEGVSGITTTSVKETIKIGSISPMAVSAQTTTDTSGYYELKGLVVDNYTIYASSMASLEKAVITNVEVIAGQSVTADDLNLTPVGSITGTVTLNGAVSGNLGILVFVAGTSYMAVTNDAGQFFISGVPTGTDYELVALREEYSVATVQVEVTAAVVTDAGMLTLEPLLPAPTGVYAVTAGLREIELSWNDNSLAEDGFEIERRPLFGSYALVATVGAGTTNYLDQSLGEGARYCYRVRAYRGGVSSPYSNEIETVTSRRILFHSGSQIYVMNADDGSGQTNLSYLSNNTANDDSPAWSPDGTQIAFHSNRDSKTEIYVMNADGSVQTNLTNNTRNDSRPAW